MAQIVGKIRLALTPWLNHGWHVPLYVTPRGLGTSPIPHATGPFEIDFDLHAHLLRIATGIGITTLPLEAGTIADFRPRDDGATAARGRRPPSRPCPTKCPIRCASPTITRRPYDRDWVERFRDAYRGRSGVQAVPYGLSWQGEPGPFLLGQLRPRRPLPLLGSRRAVTSWRGSRTARCRDARSL